MAYGSRPQITAQAPPDEQRLPPAPGAGGVPLQSLGKSGDQGTGMGGGAYNPGQGAPQHDPYGPPSGGGGFAMPGAPGGGGQGSQDWTQGYGVSEGYHGFNPNADPASGVWNPGSRGWQGADQFGSGVYGQDPGHYGGGDLQHAGWQASDIQNDPGYLYEQQQAAQATNANLAAHGLSDSGGALKELQDRAQGIASTHAGDSYNRYMGQLGFNASEAGRGFNQGQQALSGAYGRYSGDRGWGSQQGQQGWSNAQDVINRGYDRFAGERQYRQGERQRLFSNATGEDQRQWDNSFRGGQQGWQNDNTANQQNFDNYYRLAALGLGATGQNAGYQNDLGQGVQQGYNDQGNAQSQGTVSGYNSQAQGWQGAGQTGMDYWNAQRR